MLKKQYVKTLYLVEDDFHQCKIFKRKRDALRVFAIMFKNYVKQYEKKTGRNYPLTKSIDKGFIKAFLKTEGQYTLSLVHPSPSDGTYKGSGVFSIIKLVI